MRHVQKSVRSLLVLGVGLFAACSDDRPGENIALLQEELSSNARVLSFENVSADWSTTLGTISSNMNATEGSFALAASNTQNAVFASVPLSSLGTVGSNLTIDLRYPNPAPNPYWLGTLDVVIKIPSQGVDHASLGPKDLAQVPLGQYQRLSFSIPADLRAKLSSTYSDLRIEVLLNVPAGSGPWLLDRINLGQADEFTDAAGRDRCRSCQRRGNRKGVVTL